jgi:hypothetical protein
LIVCGAAIDAAALAGVDLTAEVLEPLIADATA